MFPRSFRITENITLGKSVPNESKPMSHILKYVSFFSPPSNGIAITLMPCAWSSAMAIASGGRIESLQVRAGVHILQVVPCQFFRDFLLCKFCGDAARRALQSLVVQQDSRAVLRAAFAASRL